MIFYKDCFIYLLCLIGLLACVADVNVAAVTPIVQDGKVVLYDAAEFGPDVFHNHVARWIEGDLLPEVQLMENNHEKWVDITYTGQAGMALTDLLLSPQDGSIGAPGSKSTGIKLWIDYPGPAFSMIQVQCFFSDNTNLTATFTLEQDKHEYIIEKGFRRANFPAQWGLLTMIRFKVLAENDVATHGFRLRRIELIQKDMPMLKSLAIDRVRKIAAITPLNGSLTLDGKLDDVAWQNAASLRDYVQFHAQKQIDAAQSPVDIKLAYDDQKLYLAIKAQFPTPPLAGATGMDGSVWQDEALELFFSGDRDNQRKVQFVINAKGVIFDAAVEYDLAAMGNKMHIDRQIKHEKAMQYAEGAWTLEISFPWSELAVNPKTQHFLNFQAVLSYLNRDDPRLKTVTWSRPEGGRFPNPLGFGVLLLNSKPFGAGRIDVNTVNKSQSNDVRTDLMLNCVLKDFEPGDYQLKRTLVDADGKLNESQQSFIVTSDNQHLAVPFHDVANFSGAYTCYLTLFNRRGDACMSAVNFENLIEYPDMLGERILIPEPKQVNYQDGQFLAANAIALYLSNDATPRTLRTAELFAEKWAGYTGTQLTIEKVESPQQQQHGVIMLLADNPPFKAIGLSQEHDGYRLQVDPQRVVITGYGESGLYYGGVTLIQLLKSDMQIKEDVPIACVDIVDWPDIQYRVLNLNAPQLLDRNQRFKENRGLDYLLQWVDRMAGDYKYNILVIDLSASVQYKRRPEFIGPRTIYTLDDIAKLAQFCRDRFIEPCPQWATGGHTDHWLLDVHPELREKGWRNTADVTKPEHDLILFDCMQDMIDAMAPKFLSPKGDEWWHRKMPGETPEPLLNGKTRAQVYLDFYSKLNTFLRERDVKMVMFHDMLNPHHNGKREGLELYKYVDVLPKDIILMEWSDRQPKFFLDKGFTVWAVQTGANIFPSDEADRFQGYGKGIYSFGTWLLARTEPSDVQYEFGPFWAADYAWNIRNYKHGSLKDQVISGRLVTVRNISAIDPNPVASDLVHPISLQEVTNASLSHRIQKYQPTEYVDQKVAVRLPSGVHEIGLIPMSFARGDKDCVAIGPHDKPVDVIIDQNCSSLIFLHSSIGRYTQQDLNKMKFSWRLWPYGNPNGDYVVTYEDGQTITIPLRSDDNIYWIDTHPLTRTTMGNRYVYAIKDVNGKDLQLYQLEWVNPYPAKKISKVTLKHDNLMDQDILLVAMSARQVK